LRTPSRKPSAGSAGVDGVLVVTSSPVVLVERHDVGEGAAGVDADADAAGHAPHSSRRPRQRTVADSANRHSSVSSRPDLLRQEEPDSSRRATTSADRRRQDWSMAELLITNDTVTIVLSPAEKVGALKGDVSVERSRVAAVEAVPGRGGAGRGAARAGPARARGLRLGTWRHDGVKDFVVVRPGRPAVAITVAGDEWARLLVSVDDADAVGGTPRAHAVA
jgi:hypothetical protein